MLPLQEADPLVQAADAAFNAGKYVKSCQLYERLIRLDPSHSQAYERLGFGGPGFGVFISGPSKPADIEQSLVIGAHGPRSLTVFCLGSGGVAPAREASAAG